MARQATTPRQLHFARAMRHEATPPEGLLWGILRDRRFLGHKFRRQAPLGPFIADFACLSARLVIELDGAQHAEDPGDKRRDAWFAANRFRVLRVWNNELTTNRNGVLDAVWHALEES